MKNSQKCDFRGQNFDFQFKIRKINQHFQGLNPSKRPRPSFHDILQFQNYTIHEFNIDCGQEKYRFLGFVPKKCVFDPKSTCIQKNRILNTPRLEKSKMPERWELLGS